MSQYISVLEALLYDHNSYIRKHLIDIEVDTENYRKLRMLDIAVATIFLQNLKDFDLDNININPKVKNIIKKHSLKRIRKL